MCLIKIKRTKFEKTKTPSVNQPFKATSLKGDEFKIEQVMKDVPRTEIRYYLFGFILIFKLTLIDEVKRIKPSYMLQE